MDPKERILVKSEELFLQFGIRSVSMDDISNNLGMSKKTLYQYYADKDELVDAVIGDYIGDMEHECLHCRGNAKDAIHEIFLTMDHLSVALSNMNPMLLNDLEKFHFRSYQRFRQYKEKFLAELIRKNIEWGIHDELYRAGLNVDVMCKFRLESLTIPFNVAVFPPGKYNLASLSEELLQHFIYGMATIKGHKLIQKYNQQRQKNLNHDENKK